MLQAPGLFFADVRASLFRPALSQGEVDGCNAILNAMAHEPIAFTAYALATAYHETAHTMQPITECGGPAYFTRMYDIKGMRPDVARRLGNTSPGDGSLYCGRGYVQLTGRLNYRKAGATLNLPLEQHPEIALRPDVAASILRGGMDHGWFTGYCFESYLPPSGVAGLNQFVDARRIINGTDRAQLIAGYAQAFQTALQEGGWN